jgi:hypothetical protein
MIRAGLRDDLLHHGPFNSQDYDFAENHSLAEGPGFPTWVCGYPNGHFASAWIARAQHHFVSVFEKPFGESSPDYA